MNNEDYVSHEIAQALARCGYDGQYDYMYATENFCYGNNPISFDTISVGERIPECVAYYVNDDNEDDYRGIPCPTLWQAQKWLRDEWNIHIDACVFGDCSEDADGKVADEWTFWAFGIYNTESGRQIVDDDEEYDTYESALSAGIEAALKLIEEGKV